MTLTRMLHDSYQMTEGELGGAFLCRRWGRVEAKLRLSKRSCPPVTAWSHWSDALVEMASCEAGRGQSVGHFVIPLRLTRGTCHSANQSALWLPEGRGYAEPSPGAPHGRAPSADAFRSLCPAGHVPGVRPHWGAGYVISALPHRSDFAHSGCATFEQVKK
jgi:hypothetical protein